MHIKISIGRNSDEDIVTLADGTRWGWSAWLKRTAQAVTAVRAAITEKQITPAASAGHAWLKLCGVTTHADFESLEARLPQLASGKFGRSNAMRCRKCGTRIWGKLALATGLGSECRRGGVQRAARCAMRELRAAAQGPVPRLDKSTRLQMGRAIIAAGAQ